MSDISGGTDPLKEVVEQMKRDAWVAGWNAAMEAVKTALADVMPSMDISGATPTLPGLQARNSGSNSNPSSTALPTVGTTPYYAYQAVLKKPGMTGADVVAAVRAEGHDVAEPQIRTALSRLEKRQLLANRHRKWFLK
jgi:hypothetical protein